MAADDAKTAADASARAPRFTPVDPVPPQSALPPPGGGAGSSAESGDARRMQDFLWRVHGYTNDYIRFADTKAAFCLGLALALIAALMKSSSPGAFSGHIDALSRGGASALLSMTALVLLIGSIIAAVMTVRPRLSTHSQKGFIFWEAISAFGAPAIFTSAYAAQSEEELTECLSHHLYTLAQVCRRKYFWANLAIIAVISGGALTMAVLLFNSSRR
jgi:Pycsar effector protein